MNEKYLIRTDGFRNFTENGKVAGFEVRARIAYYRGISLSLISALGIRVDGKACAPDSIRVGVNGKFFTLDEMASQESVRWEFTEALTIRVYRAGGLSPGAHDVQVEEVIKPSYIPGRGFVGEASKKLTLACVGDSVRRAAGPGLGVSLYSYQEEFFTRQMSLEDCMAEVASIGATGVQLIAEQMMPGYPNPSTQWVDKWHAMLERYGLVPTLMDTFVDMDCGGHRRLTIDEGVGQLVTQMKLARTLGFKVIRPTTGPVSDSAPDLISAAIKHAEQLDVRIAPEIHAPIPLRGGYIDSYLELIEKTKTKHVGFTLDMGIFCQRIPPAMVALARRQGVPEKVLEYVQASFSRNVPANVVKDAVAAMSAPSVDSVIVRGYEYFGPPTNKPEHIRAIAPYVFNVHGKFYEISDAGIEESIPYDSVLTELVRCGYSGHIDSEYEGQRLTQDAFVTDSCEQVRRHHLLMRRILGHQTAAAA